ncbi:MAG: FAD-binding oxidoreductase [Micrococcales bacterium]|nr:FAD-binding oxidoreductase [Micrococcales bacterium]
MDTDQLVAALGRAMGGRIDSSALTRGLYSTDASNYRVVPQVVVFPRDSDEVAAVADVARSLSVPLTSRGAGTSCAGNSIGPGIVVDCSAHLNQILELDPDARTARVQPGLVMDVLQAAAKPHGLRFGPDPSTHSRCTFGGMIGNNACGNHAVAYGRTADNVEALELIDGKGRVIKADCDLSVVDGLGALVEQHLATIRTEFGRFGRQISGYGLEHLLPEHGTRLARALVGSEGTCGIVTEATVKLVDLATSPYLVLLAYDSLPEAGDAVPGLLGFKPLALEGLDSKLVDVLRLRRGPAAVPELPAGGAWLMAEMADDSAVKELVDASGALSSRVLPSGPEAAQIWKIREDGAGLASRTPSGHQGSAGFEDAAVPPAQLGAYLRQFDRLMNEFGLEGIPYGHLGDGCLHIRLDFPLENDGTVLRQFMEQAADLVVAHGGSLSGEHGDGRARSELLPKMYSTAAIELMGQFKALFDPDNLMNPGVKVDPAPLDQDLRRPAARSQPAAGGFQFAEDGGDITRAAHRCTGVARCRTDTAGFMCPSFLATGREEDSTRGRARVLQELANGSLIGGGFGSGELAQVLENCLACKACSSDCPAGVDMARLKSETLHRRYKGRLRPPNHYLLGWLPRWTRLAAKAPGLANLVLRLPGLAKLALGAAGIDRRRSLPRFAPETFHHQAAKFDLASPLPDVDAKVAGQRPVILWADSFSSSLVPAVDLAIVEVLRTAGHDVYLAPPSVCCGLTWITTGQLGSAKQKLLGLLEVLGPFAVNGVDIVGVEPSCMAVLRGDLPDLLPGDPRAAAVAAQTKTLAQVLAADQAAGHWTPPRLDGQRIVVQPHCHHHSVMGYQADLALLRSAGAELTLLEGCCGMAGNFGMEKAHYDISVKVAGRQMLPALASEDDPVTLLADGFSCRTQAADLAGIEGLHLAQVLLQARAAN